MLLMDQLRFIFSSPWVYAGVTLWVGLLSYGLGGLFARRGGDD